MTEEILSMATITAQSGLFPIGKMLVPSPPSINATTVIAPSLRDLPPLNDEALICAGSGDVLKGFYYGGVGTPTIAALARTLAVMEGAEHALITPSGQSAMMVICSALLASGDHILVVDTITFSTRWYFDRRLSHLGIDVEYYPPDADGGIGQYIRPNTKLIVLESPGSLTFEVQDVRALAAVAKERGVLTVLDNTWAASHAFPAFESGVDAVLLSLTKYHAATAGISAGAIITGDSALFRCVKSEAALLGLYVSPDAAERAAQAILTLQVRLNWQERTASFVMEELEKIPSVSDIVQPCRPDHPQHSRWRDNFRGTNSLITLAFDGRSTREVEVALDRLKLVRHGYGWGGSVSLVMPFLPNAMRRRSRSSIEGPCVRLYIGLEDAGDIASDLSQAFSGLCKARAIET